MPLSIATTVIGTLAVTVNDTIGSPTLSLSVGVPGPAGTNGAQGIQGIQGAPGATGASGVIAASAPLAYNAGTQTVSINLSTYLQDAPNDGTPYVRLSGSWEQLLIT